MKDKREFQIPVLIPNVPEPALWTHLLDESITAARFTNGGPLARRVEKKISDYFGGTCEVVVCSSNFSGLVASLIALECRGKRVLLSNYTFAATLNAVHCAGATPILSDVDPDTWEISVEQIVKAQSEFPDIYAVLMTRVHGFIRDFERVLDYCTAQGLKVVIDSAAAFPRFESQYKVRKNVTEVFSFHATKPLGIGEGGAVLGDASIVSAVRVATNFGLDTFNQSFGDGLNAKMDEFAAARLIAAIERFKELADARKVFADELFKIFSSCHEIALPGQTQRTSWPFFPIKFQNTEKLLKFQDQLSPVVQTRRYYFPSMSEGYMGMGEMLKTSNLDVSINLAATSLCLPVVPSLDKENRNRYFSKLHELVNSFV